MKNAEPVRMDRYEREAGSSGYRYVAGMDEAGRGPLAGPVVAAAVILKEPLPLWLGIIDSKALTPKRREELLLEIYSASEAVSIGVVWQDEIDDINIHNATLAAMKMAVERLVVPPGFLLIDGRFCLKDSRIPQKAIIRGDSLSISIAAASIVAKTSRDRIMAAYHRLYPQYGFENNKGYGTRAHMDALERVGPSPVHRKSFSFKGPGA